MIVPISEQSNPAQPQIEQEYNQKTASNLPVLSVDQNLTMYKIIYHRPLRHWEVDSVEWK